MKFEIICEIYCITFCTVSHFCVHWILSSHFICQSQNSAWCNFKFSNRCCLSIGSQRTIFKQCYIAKLEDIVFLIILHNVLQENVICSNIFAGSSWQFQFDNFVFQRNFFCHFFFFAIEVFRCREIICWQIYCAWIYCEDKLFLTFFNSSQIKNIFIKTYHNSISARVFECRHLSTIEECFEINRTSCYIVKLLNCCVFTVFFINSVIQEIVNFHFPIIHMIKSIISDCHSFFFRQNNFVNDMFLKFQSKLNFNSWRCVCRIFQTYCKLSVHCGNDNKFICSTFCRTSLFFQLQNFFTWNLCVTKIPLVCIIINICVLICYSNNFWYGQTIKWFYRRNITFKKLFILHLFCKPFCFQIYYCMSCVWSNSFKDASISAVNASKNISVINCLSCWSFCFQTCEWKSFFLWHIQIRNSRVPKSQHWWCCCWWSVVCREIEIVFHQNQISVNCIILLWC